MVQAYKDSLKVSVNSYGIRSNTRETLAAQPGVQESPVTHVMQKPDDWMMRRSVLHENPEL